MQKILNEFSLLVTFCLLVGVITTGCKDDGIKPKEETKLSLVGTKWKLVSFYDVEADTFKEAEPKEDYQIGILLRDCFTLEFYVDSVKGKTSTNLFRASYIVNYTFSTIQFFDFWATAANEVFDGLIYSQTLQQIQMFELKENELKLYYNDKKNYLLYQGVK